MRLARITRDRHVDQEGSELPLHIVRTGRRTLRLVGELDIETVDALAAALRIEARGPGDVTLELGTLTFIDSTGLNGLIEAATELAGRGTLRLVGAGGIVARVFEIVRIDTLPDIAIVPADTDPLPVAGFGPAAAEPATS